MQRRIERGRFSLPTFSDKGTEIGDALDNSSYTSYHAPTPRLTSTGPEGGTSNNRKMEIAGGRSRMAVIYEQQSWEGEIINEQDMKQGRGRPRK